MAKKNHTESASRTCPPSTLQFTRADCLMARRDARDDLKLFLELTTTTALAAVSTAAAPMHGDALFGMFFGAAKAFAAVHLIRRFVDL